MGIKQFGCVRFDADDPNMGGWAAVAGGEAVRISSVGSLDNATLWWSNLSFQAMFESNLHKTSYIKRTTYLNSWLQDGQQEICLAWGFLRSSYTEKTITEALSSIFDRVMRFAGDAYDIDFARSVPMHDNLADELRCRMLPDKDPHINGEVDIALSAAHQYYTYCVTPHYNREETAVVKFAAPAVGYAREMLSAVIPSHQVDFIEERKLPPAAQRIEWVVNHARPALARVVVSDIHPDYVNVIAFANGAKAGSNRSWVTQPELLLLSKYARVEISALFLFGGYEDMPAECKLPAFTAMQSMTPTAEVIATNHWLGLARENCYKLEPKANDARAVSPRAAWLTAVDRFVMFTYGLQLHRAGIVIRRYGAGAITTLIPKHNYRDAYEIASAVGLIAPPSLVSDINVQEELQAHD